MAAWHLARSACTEPAGPRKHYFYPDNPISDRDVQTIQELYKTKVDSISVMKRKSTAIGDDNMCDMTKKDIGRVTFQGVEEAAIPEDHREGETYTSTSRDKLSGKTITVKYIAIADKLSGSVFGPRTESKRQDVILCVKAGLEDGVQVDMSITGAPSELVVTRRLCIGIPMVRNVTPM